MQKIVKIAAKEEEKEITHTKEKKADSKKHVKVVFCEDGKKKEEEEKVRWFWWSK